VYFSEDIMPSTEPPVTLSSLVAALRSEIDAMQANLAQSGRDALLSIETAEVEISFGVERSGSAKGGFSLKVFDIGFEAGADNGWNNLAQHKLKLTLRADPDIGVAVAD